MPYIRQEHREYLDGCLSFELYDWSPGELNYAITKMLISYCEESSYARYNEALGVLSAVTQEFYRRAVAPYEDQKILENGDVF